MVSELDPARRRTGWCAEHVKHEVVQFAVKMDVVLQRLYKDGELSNRGAVGAYSIGQIVRKGVRTAKLAEPEHQLVQCWLLIG